MNPRPDQRRSLSKFDVNGAQADHSPSVKSAGITGMITGTRADLIVADDVENPKNSLTQVQREKLLALVAEFDAILKPGGNSEIKYLGTPQVHDSLYKNLGNKRDKNGNLVYHTRIWPSRKPDDSEDRYDGNLAPYIVQLDIPVGYPTDPLRFDDDDLIEREGSYGRSGFALQFQLDTTLSDDLKFPLKCSDFVVMDVDTDIAPIKVSYGSTSAELLDVDCVGMKGDRWYRPRYTSDSHTEYTDSVLYIDPSGRGKDNTGYCVAKYLAGYVHIRRLGGLPGGYDQKTLTALARIAKVEKVNNVIIESNFGRRNCRIKRNLIQGNSRTDNPEPSLRNLGRCND
jgi:hypothetical protein